MYAAALEDIPDLLSNCFVSGIRVITIIVLGYGVSNHYLVELEVIVIRKL